MRPLARGGMGALYLAVHGQAGTEKVCVVKTALPHLADRSYLQRFRDEAKVVVRLTHGNLVTVFDAGEVKGELFLAMDFIEGKDLRAVWNRCAQKGTAFPISVAVHIVKELVRGLAYAHGFEGLSLVHRDVSPPNVLLSYSGEVKLTDFGLATSTLKLEKTAPGVIYGKVSYMAPEQARGEALDAKTDLYASGVILWELLTGRQLFPPGGRGPLGGDTDDDLLERVRHPEITPPSKKATRVPVELDAICVRALAADPRHRYKAGEELRSELAAFLAKTAPSTDGATVETFLRELFGEDIARERTEREHMLGEARRMLEGKKVSPAQAGPMGEEVSEEDTTNKVKQPEEPSQIVGTILSERYSIKRLCGEGGMGRVYEAEHVEIGKRVAVKVLHPAYTRTPDVVERFRREARAASKIEHPNVVNVTDSGTALDGSFFFVMEYVEGVELGFVIHKEGPLPVVRTLRIAEQMCMALQAAHDVGVIHRDLKPENILLVNNPGRVAARSTGDMMTPPPDTGGPIADVVKVLDFGIAKTLDAAELEEESQKLKGRRLTRPGVAMGTPEYMAPEQAAGKPADPRSDIYAVGSIMYEMLTGQPPYVGDNVMEVLHKKANDMPRPIADVRPEVPDAVQTLVEKSMARFPDQRPQTMAALAEEIRGVMALVMSGSAPISPPARRDSYFAAAVDPAVAMASFGLSRRALGVGAAVLVIVGALVIVKGAGSSRKPQQTVASAARPPAPAPPPQPVLPDPTPAVPLQADPEEPPDVRPKAAKGPTAAASKKMLEDAKALLKAGRYPEARQAFSLIKSPKRERSEAMVGLGQIAFQEEKYGEAADMAKKAGRNKEAQILLGDAYFKLQQYGDAKKAYEEALKIDPKNDTARHKLELASRRMN